MLNYTPRVVAVAQAVLPLRNILVHALHTSQTLHGGGKRTIQRSPRTSTTPPRQFGMKPGAATSFPRIINQRSEQSIKSPSRSDDPYIRSLQTGNRTKLNPSKTPQTTAHRLASLPPSHPRYKPDPTKDTPPHMNLSKYPNSKPFTAPSYATPKSLSSDPSSSSPKSFDTFKLHPGLLEGIIGKFGNHGRTTTIQSLSLNHFIETDKKVNRDSEEVHRILLGAETGSGKTLAYLLPLFHHLKITDSTALEREKSVLADTLQPRSIVISPTHELTRQSTVTAKYLSHSTKLSVLGLSSTQNGGVGARRGALDVLLGTGGSLRRLMGLKKIGDEDLGAEKGGSWERELREGEKRNGVVSAAKIEWVVIDEADVLLGPDFIDETLPLLAHILETSIKPLNMILVSATLPPSLLHHLRTTSPLSDKPFTHLLSPAIHKLPKSLEARFIPSSGSGNRLADVVHEIKRVFAEDAVKLNQSRTSSTESREDEKSKIVVFCNTENKVKQLAKTLEEKGIQNLAWTGEGEQRIRGSNGLLDDFLLDPSATSTSASTPKNTSRVLITTSLLSRGLDFSPKISTVLLVDPPRDILDFVHRAGRAGRAGRPGRVIVFGMGDGRGGLGFGKDSAAGGGSSREGRMGTSLGDVVGRRRGSGGVPGERVRPGGRIRLRR